MPDEIQTSLANTSRPEVNYTAKSNWFVILILALIVALLFGAGGYILGLNKSKQNISSSQSNLPSKPTLSPTNKTNEKVYNKYTYLVNHIAQKVFQTEVPSELIVNSRYWGINSSNLSELPISVMFSQPNQEIGSATEPIPYVQINFTKNKDLANKDSLQWVEIDITKLFTIYNQVGVNLSVQKADLKEGKWEEIIVNGVKGKKVTVIEQVMGQEIDYVYLTKGDLVFVFINTGLDKEKFQHMLDTFQIINSDPGI